MILDSPIISGSATITGDLIVEGTISATISGSATSASYAANAELLDGLDSTSFTTTSSFNTVSGSFSTRITNTEATASNLTTDSGSFSTRITSVEGSTISINSKTGSYATTGSNNFIGNQVISGSVTATGQIIAQTLNVQQVTSSIVYSSGSNIFGNSLANTQVMTGSVSITGSLSVNGTSAVNGTGTTNFLPKFAGASTIGNSNLINDASGNLGLGVTPSAWGTNPFVALQVGTDGGFIAGRKDNGNQLQIGQNAYYDGTNWIYTINGTASRYILSGNEFRWLNAPSGTAGNTISFTQAMTLTSAGRLLLNTTTDNGTDALQVNGSTNINGLLTITNLAARNELLFNGNDFTNIYSNTTAGIQFGISNAASTGALEFLTANAVRFTIASTGAATFSSSVTAGGLLTTAYTSTGSSMGHFIINTAASTLSNSADIWFGTWGGASIGNIYNARISAINMEGSSARSDLAFYTYGGTGAGSILERMRITYNGNVGIGTTSPAHRLDINGTARTNTLLIEGATSTTGIQISSAANAAGGSVIRLNKATATNQAYFSIESDQLYLGTAASNTTTGEIGTKPSVDLVLATSYTERMRITSAGNVGIGTTSPTSTLHIIKALGNDALGIGESGNNIRLAIGQESSYTGNYIDSKNIDLKIRTYTAGGTGGNIYLQTTNDGTSNVTTRLTITNSGYTILSGRLDFASDLAIQSASDKFSLGYQGTYGWLQTWNATPLYLNTLGNAVFAGTQRIDNNSDARLKENIESINGALQIITSLQGRKFNMLDENGKLRYGFVAQEVEPYLADFVTQSERYYQKGNTKIENLLTLETSGASWAALLVEAIKELKTQNDSLQSQINELKK